MREKPRSALLLRPGALAVLGDPESGLREDGLGGKNYIKRLVRGEWPSLPFYTILFAPPPIVRETVRAMIQAATNLIWMDENQIIAERPELYPEDSAMPSWQAMSSQLPAPQKASVEDLKKAADACIKEGTVTPTFLHQEAARIFGIIEKEVALIPEGETILCVLPSPFPEAVVLWLHETRPHPVLEGQKTMASIRMLNHLDGFAFIFGEGKLQHIVMANNRKRVRTLVLGDTWEKRLNEDSKEGRALAEFGLPLLEEK